MSSNGSNVSFLGASGTATANDRLNALLANLTGNKGTPADNNTSSTGPLTSRRGGGFDQSALKGEKFDRMFGAVVHPSVIAEQKKRELEAKQIAEGGAKTVTSDAAAATAAKVKTDNVGARVDWRTLNRAKKIEPAVASGKDKSAVTTAVTVPGDKATVPKVASSSTGTKFSEVASTSSTSVAEPTQPVSAAEALKLKLLSQQKDRAEAIDHVKGGATQANKAREEAEARALLLKYPPPPTETADGIKSILHPALHRAVFDKLKLGSLTKVQQLSWGPMSDGKGGDVLIRSETGSGKTLAYSLPLVNALISYSFGKNTFPAPEGTRITQRITREQGIYAIILCPTRELADQVSGVVQTLVTFNPNIVVGAIHGGENRHKEKARIRKGITILVATPGRLLDHLRTTEIFLGNASTNGENRVQNLQTLVLDEADRLLDMGFENAMKEICSMLSFSQKRVLVSATITSDVQRLAHFTLKQPVLKVGSLLGDDSFEVPRGLRQHYTIVPPKQRLAALLGFLRSQIDSGSRKIVVFVSTSDSCEFHYLLLSRLQNPYRNVHNLLGRKGAAKFRQQIGGKRGRDDDNFGGADINSGGPKKGHKKLLAKANAHIGYGDEDAFEELDGIDGSSANQHGFVGLNGQSYSHNTEKSGFELDEGEMDGFINCNVFKLHGNMTQVDRASVFHSFKHCGETPVEKKKKKIVAEDEDVSVDSDDEAEAAAAAAKRKPVNQQAILFCTDVAARGLDMPHIDWIVHYDPPSDERCYVHRVGRTARIGRGGDSILFFHEHEEGFAKFLLSNLLKYKENQHAEHAVESGAEKVVTAADATAAGVEGGAPASVASVTNMAIQFKKAESYLFYLTKLDPASNHHWVQAAANLQRAISICVKNDTALNRTAMFGYLSYLRAYNGFPKAVKQYFDARLLHLGHIAASFGITAKPSEIRKELEQNHAVDDERKLSRDTTQFRDHRRMEDIHKTPGTAAIGFGEEDAEENGGRKARLPFTAKAAASGYHSTLVSKQLQKTRDYHEVQKEKRKLVPKPFQFSEFDA